MTVFRRKIPKTSISVRPKKVFTRPPITQGIVIVNPHVHEDRPQTLNVRESQKNRKGTTLNPLLSKLGQGSTANSRRPLLLERKTFGYRVSRSRTEGHYKNHRAVARVHFGPVVHA